MKSYFCNFIELCTLLYLNCFNGCCYYDINLCAKILTITIFNNKTNIDKTMINQNTMLTNQQLIDSNWYKDLLLSKIFRFIQQYLSYNSYNVYDISFIFWSSFKETKWDTCQRLENIFVSNLELIILSSKQLKFRAIQI